MKRALLLAYYVPPRAAIASVRSQHLIASLRAHGWELIPVVPDFHDAQYAPPVVTTGVVQFKAPMRRLLGVRAGESTHERLGIERVNDLDGRRTWKQQAIATGHTMLSFVDGRVGWLGHGSGAVRDLVRRERIDAIVSTSPPAATHLVAAFAHGQVPWIADFRDPWARDDDLATGPVLRAVDRVLERCTLQGARTLVAASDPIAEQLHDRYPGKQVVTITNAFSSQEWSEVPFCDPPVATFMHAGQLYRGRRDPRMFLEAMASLIAQGTIGASEVRVDFYGPTEPWLGDAIDSLHLRGVVTLGGTLAREEILRRERAASRLLIFLHDGPQERGTYTGKLFEYFGARRRIIAAGGPPERTVLDDALSQCDAGRRGRDVADLRAQILEAVQEWRAGRTAIVSSEAVAPFELTHFGARYARVLDEAICAV